MEGQRDQQGVTEMAQTTEEVSKPKLPPLLTFDGAVEGELEIFATCNWGGCDRETWGLR